MGAALGSKLEKMAGVEAGFFEAEAARITSKLRLAGISGTMRVATVSPSEEAQTNADMKGPETMRVVAVPPSEEAETNGDMKGSDPSSGQGNRPKGCSGSGRKSSKDT